MGLTSQQTSQSTCYRPGVFREGGQTNGASIAWELGRTASSQTYKSEIWGGPSTGAFTSPAGDSDAHGLEDHPWKLCYEATSLDEDKKTALCCTRATK